jgi:hypothetical protein
MAWGGCKYVANGKICRSSRKPVAISSGGCKVVSDFGAVLA